MEQEFRSLRHKIAVESAERKADYARFEAVWKDAEQKGREAATACVPAPMVVVERANPFDDSSAIVERYEPIADGVCGFAWLVVRPGNSRFARWLVKRGLARKAYGGGVSVWISEYNQSMEKKQAHAQAAAKHIRESLGVNIYSQSRMD